AGDVEARGGRVTSHHSLRAVAPHWVPGVPPVLSLRQGVVRDPDRPHLLAKRKDGHPVAGAAAQVLRSEHVLVRPPFGGQHDSSSWRETDSMPWWLALVQTNPDAERTICPGAEAERVAGPLAQVSADPVRRHVPFGAVHLFNVEA